MPDPQKTVFISYRRSVASYIARSIFLDLRAHRYDVFMDVESINAGQFEQIILNQIEARAHFLVILTPGTLERCSEPGDWLRREIEYAIEKGRNVIPLFVNDFKMDDAAKKYLTGNLDVLSSLNGLNMHHDYFDEAMERLRKKFLKQPTIGALKPAPSAEQPIVEQKIKQVAAQPAPTTEQLSAEEYFSRAYQKDKAGDFDGAITDYSEAIRINPQYDKAYCNRGAARASKGDVEGAMSDFDEAIRINPQYDKAYSNRGAARASKGDVEGAMTDFDEAIRINPQYDKAYSNRGNARQAKGDVEGAISDYSEAIRINPQLAEAYNNRGIAHQAKGDTERAITDYSEAIRLNPQLAEAYNNRGIEYATKGDFNGAIADYTAAIRLKPQDADHYHNRGEVYFAIDKFSKAFADFNQADELRPADYMTVGGLAITQFALGNKAEAKRLWHSLVVQDQHYHDADWVGNEFNWRPELIEAARKLIAEL